MTTVVIQSRGRSETSVMNEVYQGKTDHSAYTQTPAPLDRIYRGAVSITAAKEDIDPSVKIPPGNAHIKIGSLVRSSSLSQFESLAYSAIGVIGGLGLFLIGMSTQIFLYGAAGLGILLLEAAHLRAMKK